MTTFDPDTLAQDKTILQGLYDRFEGKLALNAFVIRGGEIRVGDPVELFSSPAVRPSNSSIYDTNRPCASSDFLPP